MNYGKIAAAALFSSFLLLLGTAAAPDAIPAYAAASPDTVEEDAFAGRWSETVAKRAIITVVPRDGAYEVTVTWPNGAARKTYWRMTAEPAGSDAFAYEDCVCTERQYDRDGNYTEEILYENGSGTFFLNGGRLTWSNDADDVAKESVFAKR